MRRIALLLSFVALSGCALPPAMPRVESACAQTEVSYECQVERYNNVSVD